MDNKLITNTKQFIKEIFCNDCSGHDYYHALRVYKMAKKIAQAENADVQLVSIAALLHDVDDRKVLNNPDQCTVRRFLKEQNVSDYDIEKICTIIDEVAFYGTDSVVPSSIEGKCVQDADRLDAIGAIGIARAFAYGGKHQRAIYDPETAPSLNMKKEQYIHSKGTSINHFYEKLLMLKDMMNTDIAKTIAEQRHSFMIAYLDEFMAEWDSEK